MVSLHFLNFFNPPNPPPKPTLSSRSSPFSPLLISGSLAAITGASITIALSISNPNPNPFHQFLSHFRPNVSSSSPLWGSLSLSDHNNNSNSESQEESTTKTLFPTVLNDTQKLVGVGVRKKCLFGLKNINVYAFGVYADDSDVKNTLYEKYGKLSVSELKENKAFHDDIMDKDLAMTVRLQIVYGRLTMGTVRKSFEESIGSRLQKFSGTDNKELLQRFTSLLKDDIKLPRGSVIELSREHGHIFQLTIAGEQVGKIQSKLLCQAVLDLYIGEDPFDAKAKEDTELNLASLLVK
ncbi:hypothetical protein ACHQM5_027160 [Ranunculus cassubicifolius]